MNRIQKIVARGKAEIIKDAGTAFVSSTPRTSARDIEIDAQAFQYTRTPVIEVPDATLQQHRIVAQNKGDPNGRRFQLLRAKILQQMRRRNWTTLAITSPTEGSGKTLVAINLAISMAQEGNQSVLLVDLDLGNPCLYRYFNLQPRFGIHDYLEGRCVLEDTFVNPGISGLVLAPGRPNAGSASDQMARPVVRSMVEEVKHRYKSRVVIFDLPPVLLADDVMVFLPNVDCSLLVIEAGAVNRGQLNQTLDIFGSNPVLGTVLNKSTSAADGIDH